mgnify:CR=1 FL=1
MLDKSKAIEIITECAKLYERNLKSKNLLILSINNQSKRYNYIEVAFDISLSNFPLLDLSKYICTLFASISS